MPIPVLALLLPASHLSDLQFVITPFPVIYTRVKFGHPPAQPSEQLTAGGSSRPGPPPFFPLHYWLGTSSCRSPHSLEGKEGRKEEHRQEEVGVVFPLHSSLHLPGLFYSFLSLHTQSVVPEECPCTPPWGGLRRFTQLHLVTQYQKDSGTQQVTPGGKVLANGLSIVSRQVSQLQTWLAEPFNSTSANLFFF